MPLVKPVATSAASSEQKQILDSIRVKLGTVPNIYATMAHSPATLQSMLAYSSGLQKGVLSHREIEAVALAVAQANSCDYCLAAHTLLGKMAGLTLEETLELRQARSREPKLDALVKLAAEIAKTQGKPSATSLEAFRKAGYNDAALVELIAWVTYNLFTNYFNRIIGTEIDFPTAPQVSASGGCSCAH